MIQGLYGLAAAGNLFLALVVALGARRAQGAVPLALTCASLFVWAVSEAVIAGGPVEPWDYVGLVGSSLAPAFLWHFVVAFVGATPRLRASVVVFYAVAATFAAGTAAALVSPAAARVVDGPAWNVAYLAVLFPFFVASLAVVVLRLRRLGPGVERNALGFVAAGIAIGAAVGFTEVVAFLEPRVPKLGHVGGAVAAGVLAVAIFRHRLLRDERPLRDLFVALLLLLSAGLVAAVAYRPLPGPGAAAAVALTAVAVAGFATAVRLREKAERRERLALLGTMAAGVAHEIRNPLAAIKGAAQFVEKEVEAAGLGGEARDYLRLVSGEVDRLNGVLEAFLTYARPLEPRRQEVDLRSLVGDVVRLQSASFPPGVRAETGFDGPPTLAADPGLLTIALVNLVRNAAEAMPGGGVVAVRTRTAAEGLRSYAVLEVVDTGPGVPRQDLRRIFEPFVTTKAKGSGLGLAIARRIAEAHGGEIRVENLAPRGCRFAIVLPVG
ncbi:MAG TPA: ATP-binding protein [Planctomycetota bacterium]|nr:ATP-binding protein [Planctomycetota bacterium]